MRASLLERQERFLHDASHELRTPVTIARGHLELLCRETAGLARARGRARRARADGADRRPAAPSGESQAAGLRASCATSRSTASSRTCSCAGRRWPRARGGSTWMSPGWRGSIPRRCGARSTRSSRTRSRHGAACGDRVARARGRRRDRPRGRRRGNGRPRGSAREHLDRFARADDARRVRRRRRPRPRDRRRDREAHGGRCTVERRDGRRSSARSAGRSGRRGRAGRRRVLAPPASRRPGSARELALFLARNVHSVPELQHAPLDPEGKVHEAGERGHDAGHEDRIGDDCGCECHARIIGAPLENP